MFRGSDTCLTVFHSISTWNFLFHFFFLRLIAEHLLDYLSQRYEIEVYSNLFFFLHYQLIALFFFRKWSRLRRIRKRFRKSKNNNPLNLFKINTKYLIRIHQESTINKLIIDLSRRKKKERKKWTRKDLILCTRLLHRHGWRGWFYFVWINKIYTPIERNIDLFTWEQV